MGRANLKGASIFSGGCIADLGIEANDVEMIWGIEKDEKIAGHANTQVNYPIYIKDILDVDPGSLERPDIFHLSPPCPSFSRSNKNKGETELDIALAKKCAEFIEVLQPDILTIENVWQYRNSESWRIIASCLNKIYGFGWHVAHVNSADFGVPQTRMRLIARAVKGGSYIPPLPGPEKWVGWYEVVEDIIHTFKESKLADWQLEKLPVHIKDSFVINSSMNQAQSRQRERYADDPMQTVTTSTMWKVVLVAGDNASRSPTCLDRSVPAFTVLASGGRAVAKALDIETAKVIIVSPRGLARFQSIPDSYILPDKIGLATTIIGNSVPPLMMEKVYKQLLEFYGGLK